MLSLIQGYIFFSNAQTPQNLELTLYSYNLLLWKSEHVISRSSAKIYSTVFLMHNHSDFVSNYTYIIGVYMGPSTIVSTPLAWEPMELFRPSPIADTIQAMLKSKAFNAGL